MMNSMQSNSGGTRCPVCGMGIDEKSPEKVEYKGQTYLVASDDCKSRFLADPEKYTAKAKESDSQHSHHGGGHGCC